MTELLLCAAKFALRFLYLFLRPLPVRNKIVFFSRQSSEIPLDFRLLAEDAPFFLLRLRYEGDTLVEAALNGAPISL